MRNILLIIKHEIAVTLGKPSFWVMTILFPLFFIGLNLGTQLMAQNALAESRETNASRVTGNALGYVDEAGIINALPEGVDLIVFSSQEEAQAAMAAGELQSYAVITQDYLQSGELIIVQENFNPMGVTMEDLYAYVITYNLSGGDAALTTALTAPVQNVRSESIVPPGDAAGGRGEQDEALTFLVPFAVMFIFFFLITMSGGYMLQSVSREKENRTVEVLLLSLNPRQLMLGKIVGLSVVALFQMALWLGGGMLALGNAGQLMNSAAAFQLPPGFLVWSAVYFLLGYLMYASLLGAVGALAPSAKESGQLTFIVMLPLIIPLWFNQALLQNPDGLVAKIFSMIPFTAPVSMLTRLAVVDVPLWELLASAGGLAFTTYLMILLAARFFRADTLLSTSPIKKERIFSALRG